MKSALAVVAALTAVACGNSDNPAASETHTVTVRLTDAPADDLESATIFVSQIALQPGGASADEVIVSNTKASYDLLTLQNGVSTVIATAEISAATLHQIRVKVDSARVVLKSGHTFGDGTSTATLKIPSGSESGLKINISPPITVTDNTILLVDFDLSQSFVFQGPRDHPNSVSFKPVLHATAMDVAGSIAGTVTPVGKSPTVYAIIGTDTLQTAFPDATTGAYTLQFLAPGTYTVAAKATGFQVALSPPVVVANAQSMTGVNLVLVPLP